MELRDVDELVHQPLRIAKQAFHKRQWDSLKARTSGALARLYALHESSGGIDAKLTYSYHNLAEVRLMRRKIVRCQVNRLWTQRRKHTVLQGRMPRQQLFARTAGMRRKMRSTC